MTPALLAGLALGLVGSGHCIAMCGPLVALARPTRAREMVLYHAGRITTYALIGLVAGMWGAAAVAAGLGRPLAIGAGLVLLVYAAAQAGLVGRMASGAPGSRLVTAMLAEASQWMRRHRLTGPFAFGALNGLLPCGLVYAAAVGAVGLGSLIGGLSFMVAFGIGTAPALSVLGASMHGLRSVIPSRLRRAAPAALALVALLLIVRGAVPHTPHTPADTSPATSEHTHP